MDCDSILAHVVIGCLLVVGRVSAYFNQTYGAYSFILSNVNAENSQGKTALTSAQEWCKSYGYTLATIPNKDVQNYIKQFISNGINNGLISTMDLIILNGKLYTSLLGTWIWVNGQQLNGVNIQDQRDPSQGYFYGFLKTSDYKIYTSAHNKGRPFICEKPGNANDCVGGLPLNGRCYQRKTNSLSWYNARNDCIEGGGDLASFETLNDNTFNSTLGSTLLANASATEFWVGIQRAEWRWEDTGFALKYTSWESGSPSNAYDCLCLRVSPGTSEWLWFGFDCSWTYRFICTATAQTTVVTTTPTTIVKDTPPTKSVPGPVLTSSSSNTSIQPASIASQTNSIALALGLGIGLGMGAILVAAIVLGVIFIRRRQKRRQNDASAVQVSTLQQSSTFSSTALKSSRPDTNSSPKNEMHLGRTSADTSDPYETLQSTDARSTESPYQQLSTYEALN